jgi:hypothetical protein
MISTRIMVPAYRGVAEISQSSSAGEFYSHDLTEQDLSPSPEHCYLATLDNYHLTRENASYRLDSEMGGMESPR